MSNRIHLPRRLLAFALTLALAVSIAAPAAAKGPILYPSKCVAGDGSVRADCLQQSGPPPGTSTHDDGGLDGGLVAGIVAVLGLLLVGGIAAATQRPTAGGASQPELRGRFS